MTKSKLTDYVINPYMGCEQKSSLVRRDFEILKELNVELGMSINSLDVSCSSIVEPQATPPEERIETLYAAKKLGINVF